MDIGCINEDIHAVRAADASFIVFLTSVSPVKMPVPKAARWTARLKAKWDGRVERQSQSRKKNPSREQGIVCVQ